MLIIAGLGNPGAKYAGHRHNIGFMAVDAIAEAHGFSPWRSKFQAEICDGCLGNEKVLLIKPQTFMNLSGQAVGEAMRFYKLTPDDVIVLYDELDLAPGKVRVKTGGGHAGHNGIRSLHQHIGPDFTKVRLGIGHPGDKRLVTNHVLGDFAKADRDWLDDLLRGIADGAPKLAAGDASGFMNAVALKMKPPTPKADEKPVEENASSDKPDPQSGDDAPASPFAALKSLLTGR
jgi:PTH1 family peptidyl-tRNA hydrolase